MIATSRIRHMKEFNFKEVGEWQWLPWGSNPRPCAPHGKQLFLTSFCWLSQRPGVVAVWYNHPKSRPVRSGCHFMVRYDPDQHLGLFWSKHAYCLPLTCPVAFSIFSLWAQRPPKCFTVDSNKVFMIFLDGGIEPCDLWLVLYLLASTTALPIKSFPICVCPQVTLSGRSTKK